MRSLVTLYSIYPTEPPPGKSAPSHCTCCYSLLYLPLIATCLDWLSCMLIVQIFFLLFKFQSFVNTSTLVHSSFPHKVHQSQLTEGFLKAPYLWNKRSQQSGCGCIQMSSCQQIFHYLKKKKERIRSLTNFKNTFSPDVQRPSSYLNIKEGEKEANNALQPNWKRKIDFDWTIQWK